VIDPVLRALAEREAFRDRYARERDPISDERLSWRAHSLRNTVHLLPDATVLELGCGEGRFTRQLAHATKGENPITAVTFTPGASRPAGLDRRVEFVAVRELPGALAGRRFDVVVGLDLLDRRNCAWLLARVHDLLAPGGKLCFYESNPWNPLLRLRRRLAALAGGRDPRQLLDRTRLYELASEIGFLRVFATYNDFAYAPLTRGLVWKLRNVSTLLENTPGVRLMAGAILIHGQKPPREVEPRAVSLCRHPAFRGTLSVVIPCRNEEANVRALVEGLRRHYDEYLHQIVLVDDGSTDGTRDEMRSLAELDPRVVCIERAPPHGVGRALADGLAAATGEWVLTLDCDFQHLLPDLPDLFDAAAAGAEVAVGSRFSPRSVLLNYPYAKIVANRAFHACARALLGRGFRDLTNNLKLMRREVAAELVLFEEHFAVNAEIGFLPLLAGRRVEEVPVSWINRTPDMGSSSFRLARVGRGYARVLWHLGLLRWFRRGRYRSLPLHASRKGTERRERFAPREAGS
jgi:SAM-dependent methyltransferase